MKRSPSNLGANFSDEDELADGELSRPPLSAMPSCKKKKSKLLEKKSEKIGRISDLGFGGKGKFRSGYLMGSVVRGRSGDGGGGCGGDGSGEEAGFLHLCG